MFEPKSVLHPLRKEWGIYLCMEMVFEKAGLDLFGNDE